MNYFKILLVHCFVIVLKLYCSSITLIRITNATNFNNPASSLLITPSQRRSYTPRCPSEYPLDIYFCQNKKVYKIPRTQPTFYGLSILILYIIHYTLLHIYIYIYIFIYIDIHIYTYLYICIYIYTSVHVYIYIYIYLDIYIYVYMYVYMYVHMYNGHIYHGQ